MTLERLLAASPFSSEEFAQNKARFVSNVSEFFDRITESKMAPTVSVRKGSTKFTFNFAGCSKKNVKVKFHKGLSKFSASATDKDGETREIEIPIDRKNTEEDFSASYADGLLTVTILTHQTPYVEPEVIDILIK